MELDTDVAGIRSVFLLGDGWHNIELQSFQVGRWRLTKGAEVVHDMGVGFRFQSPRLGTVTGQVGVVGTVATEPVPAAGSDPLSN